MSGTGILMMVLICGFVWGGLALLITKAVRSEAAKSGVSNDG